MKKQHRSAALLIGNVLLIVTMVVILVTYIHNTHMEQKSAALSAMEMSVEKQANGSKVYFTAYTSYTKTAAAYIESRRMSYDEAFDYLGELQANDPVASAGYALFSQNTYQGKYLLDGMQKRVYINSQTPIYKLLAAGRHEDYRIQALKGNNPYSNNAAIMFYEELELRGEEGSYLLCYYVDEADITDNNLTSIDFENSSSMVVDSDGIQILRSKGNNIGSSYENIFKYFESRVVEEKQTEVAQYASRRIAASMKAQEHFTECLRIKNAGGDVKSYYFCFYPLEETAGWYYISTVPTESIEAGMDLILPLILGVCMLIILVYNIIAFGNQNRRLNASLRETIEAKHQAELANSSKSVFLSNMSHDIRTPLNAITGMTNIALMSLGDQDKVRDSLDKIRTSSGLLLGIINDILDMSKIESGKLELTENAFRIEELLRSLDDVFRPQTEQRGQQLSVRNHLPEDCTVVADAVHLQQILVNILSNAVKYTGEGGEISMTADCCGRDEKDGRIGICFSVADNGIGISKEYQEKIFEAFSREIHSGTNRIQGTGLGMAIAKKLVDLMEGSISVDSTPGKGSTFTVTLWMPLYDARKHRDISVKKLSLEKGETEELLAEDFGGACILVAEDNQINMEIICRLLENFHCCPQPAENGQVCVEKFKSQPPGTYRCILMDIQMPVMDGYAAARAIRALPRPDAQDIPIVAMTANAFREDVDKALAAGMNAHLAKPIDLSQLLGRLRQFIQGEEM